MSDRPTPGPSEYDLAVLSGDLGHGQRELAQRILNYFLGLRTDTLGELILGRHRFIAKVHQDLKIRETHGSPDLIAACARRVATYRREMLAANEPASDRSDELSKLATSLSRSCAMSADVIRSTFEKFDDHYLLSLGDHDDHAMGSLLSCFNLPSHAAGMVGALARGTLDAREAAKLKRGKPLKPEALAILGRKGEPPNAPLEAGTVYVAGVPNPQQRPVSVPYEPARDGVQPSYKVPAFIAKIIRDAPPIAYSDKEQKLMDQTYRTAGDNGIERNVRTIQGQRIDAKGPTRVVAPPKETFLGRLLAYGQADEMTHDLDVTAETEIILDARPSNPFRRLIFRPTAPPASPKLRGPNYDQGSNLLADAATKLRDENTAVLAENARLRRQVEDLERKLKGRK